jgi:hypothetical protein
VLTNKEPALGFSYWLEGGSIQHFGTSAGRANPIYLRDNKQLRLNDREPLESWEPMTPTKMGLIALKLHVVGDARTAPWAPSEPSLAAVTISPQGFVFKGIDNDIYVSDVRTLATSEDPFDDDDRWTLYSLNEDTGEIQAPRAQPPAVPIGGGVLPVPEKDLWNFEAGSLTAFGENVVLPLERAGNDVTAEMTDETKSFVYHHLGVDISRVDWEAAQIARLINAEYGNPAKTANVAPFSPQKALRALQNAITTNATRTRTNPSMPTFRPTHGQSGGYRTPPDKPSR